MSISRLHSLKTEVGNHSLFIVLTNRCNTICRYCSCMPVLGTGWKELPTNLISELLEWFSQRRDGMQSVQFSGGEPFLHPGAFELISKSKKLGFITRLQTNGLTVIDLSSSELETLRDVRVKVSIDGPVAEMHERFRRKGSFKNVVKGIEYLLSHDVSVGGKAVFTKYNVGSGADLVRFLGDLGLHGFTYNLMEYTGYARSLRDVSVTEYEVTKSIIGILTQREYRHLLNGTNILRWYLNGRAVIKDRLPWFIDQNGDVYRGQVFSNLRKVGNLHVDKWEGLFTHRNPGYETIRCDKRTFSLINRRLGPKNFMFNIR